MCCFRLEIERGDSEEWLFLWMSVDISVIFGLFVISRVQYLTKFDLELLIIIILSFNNWNQQFDWLQLENSSNRFFIYMALKFFFSEILRKKLFWKKNPWVFMFFSLNFFGEIWYIFPKCWWRKLIHVKYFLHICSESVTKWKQSFFVNSSIILTRIFGD